jgi:hypothetical protein
LVGHWIVSITLKLPILTAVATQIYHSCNAELVRSPVSKYGTCLLGDGSAQQWKTIVYVFSVTFNMKRKMYVNR